MMDTTQPPEKTAMCLYALPGPGLLSERILVLY